MEAGELWKENPWHGEFAGCPGPLAQLGDGRLLDKVGVKNVIEFAKTVGITSPLAADLSLGLGSSSVGLMELTSAYGVLLNQGTRAELHMRSCSWKDNAERCLNRRNRKHWR